MNILPNIAGTVANWPMQGSLADTSGNGLNLITLGWGTPGTLNAPGGTEAYATLDTCLQGFAFDGATKLLAAFSPLFQINGPMTIQFLLKFGGDTGGNQVLGCCVDPTRFGGGGGTAHSVLGNLYTYFWSNDIHGRTVYYTDEGHGGANYSWLNGMTPLVAHSYAFRRAATGVLTMWVDGVQRAYDPANGTITAASNSIVGNERFYVGGCDSTFNDTLTMGAVMAGYRVVNYARTDAQILADANFAMSTTCAQTPVYPVTDDPGNGDGTDPAGSIVYDAVAAAQFGIALRQAPRS